MKFLFSRHIHFINLEPHRRECPKCRIRMTWYSDNGPFGGWECVKCGRVEDYKPGLN